ncbi:hypothetical protein DB346_11675 [Verrucomicrobia bacterium LW23]|nr:hypothetical protein DB346_11675 [Verrucomicrobia bacterium LW23]
MAHHDEHAAEPAPSISQLDVVWFLFALLLGAFSFLFIALSGPSAADPTSSGPILDYCRDSIWPYIGWII